MENFAISVLPAQGVRLSFRPHPVMLNWSRLLDLNQRRAYYKYATLPTELSRRTRKNDEKTKTSVYSGIEPDFFITSEMLSIKRSNSSYHFIVKLVAGAGIEPA